MGCCFSKNDVIEPLTASTTENVNYHHLFESNQNDEYFNPYIVDQKSVFI
jgi:hypothetical protein